MWVENVENLLTLSDLRGLEFFSANLRGLKLNLLDIRDLKIWEVGIRGTKTNSRDAKNN